MQYAKGNKVPLFLCQLLPVKFNSQKPDTQRKLTRYGEKKNNYEEIKSTRVIEIKWRIDNLTPADIFIIIIIIVLIKQFIKTI